jgi:hypothetical protein
MNEIKKKLVALEAKVDAKLFNVMRGPDGKWYREDGTEANSVGDFKSAKGAAVAVGAAGAGLGALAGDRALMNRYGGGGSGMQTRMAALRSAGRDAMETGRFYGGKAIDAGNDGFRAGQRSFRATKPGAIGNKSGSMGLFGRLRKALGTGARIATGGRLRFGAEIKQRLVEMSSQVQKADARKMNEYKAMYLKNQNAEKAAKAGKKAAKITPEFQRAVFRAVFGKARL